MVNILRRAASKRENSLLIRHLQRQSQMSRISRQLRKTSRRVRFSYKRRLPGPQKSATEKRGLEKARKRRREMARLPVQQVWASNLWEELPLIVRALDTARYAVLDTEFPGFLHFTPAHATPRELYRDVRRNVDSLKILQVGFSVFCHDGWRRNWQVNFNDFDLSSPSDLRWEPSVALLQTNGMNFEKSRRDGVPAAVFFGELRRRLDWTGRGAESKPLWVTFHGLYDAAYLVSLLTWAPLPESLGEFARLAGRFLGRIVDLKTVAESCGEASAGLIRTCKNLEVTTSGEVTRHQAGPQSTLTGRLFTRMMVRVLRERMEEFVGLLHGIEAVRIVPPPPPPSRFFRGPLSGSRVNAPPFGGFQLVKAFPFPPNRKPGVMVELPDGARKEQERRNGDPEFFFVGSIGIRYSRNR